MLMKQLGLLLGFVFIDVLGYSLFFPILPYYADLFGAGATLVGFMIAANAAAQFIASPVVGHLSDRFGRRPLIIVSIIGTMVSFLLLGFAEPIGRFLANSFLSIKNGQEIVTFAAGWTIFMLFFCRILDGVSGGNISLARAYVSDITDEENRAKGLGLIGAAFGLGFVIGPAIGGTVSNWAVAADLVNGWGLSRFAAPAFAAVLFSLINLIGVIVWLPESLPRDRRVANQEQRDNESRVSSWHKLFAYPQLRSLLIMRFVFSLALTMLMANFALYTKYGLNVSDQKTSYLITYAGVLLILVQAFGVGWITARIKENKIVVMGLIIVSSAMFGLSLVSNLVLVIILLMPLAVAGGIVNTILNSLISKSVSSSEVGAALGAATSAESLTWIIAPILGGLFIGLLGGWTIGLLGGLLTLFLSLFAWRKLLVAQDNSGDITPESL